tara:strand:- start:528 stop:1409 length:882 start_codon:yes stop_codon:yes gene_type:complete
MHEPKKLVLVTGASGAIGRDYLEEFSELPEFDCVAIARREFETSADNFTFLELDLLDEAKVNESIQTIDFSVYSEVVFIHSVGMFKYEPNGEPSIDNDEDGIDDEVYKTNIETFVNIIKPLYKRMLQSEEGFKLSLYGMGSVSDKHQIKYWQSYTKSKNILRSIIYNLIQENPEQVKGMMFNVSTVDTEKENELRPNAEKTYWLSGKEIAVATLPFIIKGKFGEWKELDIFKNSPLFEDGYYENLSEIRKRWEQQMKQNENPGENIFEEIDGEVATRLFEAKPPLDGPFFKFR